MPDRHDNAASKGDFPKQPFYRRIMNGVSRLFAPMQRLGDHDVAMDAGSPADHVEGSSPKSSGPLDVGTPSSTQIMEPGNVFMGQDFSGRDEVLAFISNKAVELGIADDADALVASFLVRESEGTTGMMDGFAIPHAKSPTVKRPAVIVVKGDSGVGEWDTMDNEPVEVAIALLIPASEAGAEHLRLLSCVAEALMDDDFRESIKRAVDPEDVSALVNARLV